MCGIAVDSPLMLSSLPIVQFFLIKNEFVNKMEIKLYIKKQTCGLRISFSLCRKICVREAGYSGKCLESSSAFFLW